MVHETMSILGDDSYAPTRQSLIARLQDAGDQDGWREFFATYWRLIYSVARKSGLDDGEAQDLVQETVLSVSRKIAGFRYDPALGTFKNWLMLITRSRIADYLRKKHRRPVLVSVASDDDGTTYLSGAPDPAVPALEAMWESEWQEHLLDNAVRAVKERVTMQQFQVFDLAVVQLMPPAKIAATMGMSAARVYLIKHRVGRMLKAELERQRRRMENESGRG